MDSSGCVLTAIECLKDLGLSHEEIHQRITGWIAKSGHDCHWRDLPNKAQEALGRAMQKYFESEFIKQRKAA